MCPHRHTRAVIDKSGDLQGPIQERREAPHSRSAALIRSLHPGSGLLWRLDYTSTSDFIQYPSRCPVRTRCRLRTYKRQGTMSYPAQCSSRMSLLSSDSVSARYEIHAPKTTNLFEHLQPGDRHRYAKRPKAASSGCQPPSFISSHFYTLLHPLITIYTQDSTP